jgi:HEPN domain-containing protein
LLDFSLDNLPATCRETLKEAIACHAAGAHRAAAMMVRRLLEEICADNNAKGADLHKRLETLKTLVVLPQALFDAMGELKALGNDAAHVEARAYDNIGREEAEDSIELAKEILKALYQLKGLVARLQARKGTP